MNLKRKPVRQTYKGGEGSATLSVRPGLFLGKYYWPTKIHRRRHPEVHESHQHMADMLGLTLSEFTKRALALLGYLRDKHPKMASDDLIRLLNKLIDQQVRTRIH